MTLIILVFSGSLLLLSHVDRPQSRFVPVSGKMFRPCLADLRRISEPAMNPGGTRFPRHPAVAQIWFSRDIIRFLILRHRLLSFMLGRRDMQRVTWGLTFP